MYGSGGMLPYGKDPSKTTNKYIRAYAYGNTGQKQVGNIEGSISNPNLVAYCGYIRVRRGTSQDGFNVGIHHRRTHNTSIGISELPFSSFQQQQFKMPAIKILNNSSHHQTFEIHGFPDNPSTITIPGNGGEGTVHSPDGKQISGAIIAVHDGHEGEQAEVTFNGFPNGGNQYYDISYIVGGGGNLTIEQVGKPHTVKGDATFMQDCDAAWKKLGGGSQKDHLKQFVHIDGKGKVARIDPPKNDKTLEEWVRTFAHGVYVGVGAWGDSKGNEEDNKQSSGTPGGNSDLLVRFSDNNDS